MADVEEIIVTWHEDYYMMMNDFEECVINFLARRSRALM